MDLRLSLFKLVLSLCMYLRRKFLVDVVHGQHPPTSLPKDLRIPSSLTLENRDFLLLYFSNF